jgi:undecaprenyl-diphosphatase
MKVADFDRTLERVARRHPASEPARFLAQLCSPRVMMVEGFAAAAVLRKSGRAQVAVAAAAPLAIGIGKVMKRLISRQRPLPSRLRKNGRQSFPSTHMAGTTALLSCLWLVAPPTLNWRAGLSLATIGGLVVAIERLTAGAHWPSDVAAGALLGGIVGTSLGCGSRRQETQEA